ncbi:MAG: glycosyltransferase [Calditrichaeota bacterium]|nr:glycosyltransferase [Calditrichota bacterium]
MSGIELKKNDSSKLATKPIVEIWGTYPPPYGGVSVHIKRLFHGLKTKSEFNAVLLNFNGELHQPDENIFKVRSVLLQFFKLPFKSPRIIHLHARKRFSWFLLAMLGWRHTKVLTLHNQTLRDDARGLKKWLISLALKKFQRIFLNDPDFKQFLIRTFRVKNESLFLVGAFIPPLNSEFKGVPDEIRKFRRKKQFLISFVAWMLVREKGKDIYGVDSILRLMKTLKNDGIDVGLVLILPQIGDADYYRKILNEITQSGLKEDILLIQKPIPNAFEIWGICDLFIRPTLSDIEGMSVKEALYVGTPVIASDVCLRPESCLVYPAGDFNRLVELTKKVLLGGEGKLKSKFEESALSGIIQQYRELINNPNR